MNIHADIQSSNIGTFLKIPFQCILLRAHSLTEAWRDGIQSRRDTLWVSTHTHAQIARLQSLAYRKLIIDLEIEDKYTHSTKKHIPIHTQAVSLTGKHMYYT